MRRLITIIVCTSLCAVLSGARQGTASDEIAERRAEIDATFHDELSALARRCKQLGMPEAARTTAGWLIRRDPNRQYIFLVPEPDATTPPTDAPLVTRQWHNKFRAKRTAHADALWQLSGEALLAGHADVAIRLLFEVLHEDPDHESARRILGFRRHKNAWQSLSTAVAVRRGRQRHAQFGWRGHQYWQIESQHYRVETNHSRRAGTQLVQHLEQLYSVWQQLFIPFWTSQAALEHAWQDSSPVRETGSKHRVILFGKRDQYVRHLQAVEPRIGITLGIYRHPERTAYFYAGPDTLAATWRHEAVHQLFHEVSRASEDVGLSANFWIVEGVALYVESLQHHGDYCTLGGIDAHRLQYARYRALNESFYIPMKTVVSMGRLQIQQHARIRRLYSQFAGLTHLLMHYDNGRYRPALVNYLRAVYAGRDRASTLAELVGAKLSKLDAEYREFLHVTDEDLAHLEFSPGIKQLSLGYTSVSDAGLAHLEQQSDLQWLDLSHCGITDGGILHLQGARKLRQCNLEYTKVSDAALDTIRHWEELQELDLSHTAVTDEGVARLTSLEKLKVLWLTGTRITDAALDHLVELTSLESLDVSGTRVTPGAVRRLRKSLPSLREPISTAP